MNLSSILSRRSFVSVAAFATLLFVPSVSRSATNTAVYEGQQGPGKGKHVVLISGDEEYRSEEALPLLGKILSAHHGFKSTVLFSLDPDGTINPDNNASLPGAEALDTADVIVMLVRWRQWPAEQMRHFAEAFKRGVPIIALRTSTHAFKYDAGHELASFNSFSKKVIGEDWVSHWGVHKSEATRGVIEPAAKDHPLLRGVSDVFGTTDVYEVYPPADATILMRGQVLKGMNPDDAPADHKKARATDKVEQGVNNPMMPIAWVREHQNESGKTNKIFCTTMGAATDLTSEDLRRFVVNSVYWGAGLEVPQKANVAIVGAFEPTGYGFKGFKKGMKPADFALDAAAP
jgi:hypothetical protein